MIGIRLVMKAQGARRTLLVWLLAVPPVFFLAWFFPAASDPLMGVLFITFLFTVAVFSLLVYAIPLAFVFAIWRALKKPSVGRLVLALALAVPAVFVVLRQSIPEHKIECLADISCEGNQAAVLSRFDGFLAGYSMFLVCRGADCEDWIVTPMLAGDSFQQEFFKWRRVRLVTSPTGVAVYRGRFLVEEFPASVFSYDHKKTIKGGYGFYAPHFNRALAPIDGGKKAAPGLPVH